MIRMDETAPGLFRTSSESPPPTAWITARVEYRQHDHHVVPILEKYRMREAKDSGSPSRPFDDRESPRMFSDLDKRLSNGE